jgi:hypothetical protein
MQYNEIYKSKKSIRDSGDPRSPAESTDAAVSRNVSPTSAKRLCWPQEESHEYTVSHCKSEKFRTPSGPGGFSGGRPSVATRRVLLPVSKARHDAKHSTGSSSASSLLSRRLRDCDCESHRFGNPAEIANPNTQLSARPLLRFSWG